jgi:hypothetical protein
MAKFAIGETVEKTAGDRAVGIVVAAYSRRQLSMWLGLAARHELLLHGSREQRPRETELVSVGINQMEEALTPLSIPRLANRLVSRCAHAVVKTVNIGNIEDCSPPPGPAPLSRLGNDVKITRPGPKAREC